MQFSTIASFCFGLLAVGVSACGTPGDQCNSPGTTACQCNGGDLVSLENTTKLPLQRGGYGSVKLTVDSYRSHARRLALASRATRGASTATARPMGVALRASTVLAP